MRADACAGLAGRRGDLRGRDRGDRLAHALTVGHGVPRVMLVDDRAPLSLTSDKSTEAYRNWWPGPDQATVQLMNSSIDLLEHWADASDNRFGLDRRGYVYATTDAHTAQRLMRMRISRRRSRGRGRCASIARWLRVPRTCPVLIADFTIIPMAPTSFWIVTRFARTFPGCTPTFARWCTHAGGAGG